VRTAALALVTCLVAGSGLSACSADDPEPARPGQGSPATLSRDEVTTATTAAEEVIRREEARVTSATVTASYGRVVEQSNTGHRCTSGQLLRVRLVGSFPHLTTSGGPPGGDGTDGIVRTVLLTVDGGSGRTCVIGVSTRALAPLPGGVALDVG
jgi:hypothetical protein